MTDVAINHARDIDDATFLAAVRKTMQLRPGIWATRWDVQAVLAGLPEFVSSYARDDTDQAAERGLREAMWNEMERRVPGKVVLAKMRRLEGRQPPPITCCSCGCRGDIELTAVA